MTERNPGDPQSIDLALLRRVGELVRPLFTGPRGWRGWVGMAALVAVLAFLSSVEGANTFVQRAIVDHLAAREPAALYRALGLSLAALLVIQCGMAIRAWLASLLALRWRRRLTADLLGRYFAHRVYLAGAGAFPDNPDERMTEDVDLVTRNVVRTFGDLSWSCLRAVVYLPIVWSIAPGLFPFLVLYAAAGSFLFVKLFGSLARLDAIKLRVEADLRAGLMRIRSFAEAIALAGGEEREGGMVGERFERVLDNALRIIVRTLKLDLAQTVYAAAVTVVPMLVVAPRYFRHELDLGAVLQLGVATTWVMKAFSFIIGWFDQFTAVAAYVNRLGGLRGHLRTAEPARGVTRVSPGAALRLEGLTVLTPAGARVTPECDVDLGPGKGLLIRGPSGSGKTALLRAIGGIWPFEGTIVRPSFERIAVVPQQPYLVHGSLRSQLAYPGGSATDDAQLTAVIALVGLERLLDDLGLDGEWDFDQTLSPGEQQRIAFGRALLAGADLVLLDEATGAIDLATELRLYVALRARGCTFVSTGHRPSLRPLHDVELTLGSIADWLLEERSVGFAHRS